MITAAAREHPLPDDQPAAALWWRLARHFTPAAMAATNGSGAATLRPSWTPTLGGLLGAARTERALADPAWPALVAAVSDADPRQWTPEQLLTTAIDLVLAEHGTQPDIPADPSSAPVGMADADLASALVWHVAMLTDPAPLDYGNFPPDPYGHTDERPADHDRRDRTSPAADADTPHSVTSSDPSDDDGRSQRLDDAILRAQTLREPPAPTDDELWAPLLEEHKWATAAIPKQRLLDLNQRAADFFTACYPDSWARDYLQDRLGTDLTEPVDAHGTRYTPGYAPAGWTTLAQHLHQAGATDQEILAAGLARTSSIGRTIDTFRDRLVFPIYHDDDLVGFIGRRNPIHDTAPEPTAGPKYLNTPQTDLFDKGTQLFGVSEASTALAAGAIPTLVEGPLDAIAVTLATNGSYVGVAPLGTSFTDNQANQLADLTGPGQPDALVAMDNDPPGRRSAQRAYWQITARRGNPQQATLSDGVDPADVLHRDGPVSLRNMLRDTRPLVRLVIDETLLLTEGESVPPEPRTQLIDSAIEAIAALPPEQWRDQAAYSTELYRSSQHLSESAVIAAAERWTQDPRSQARTEMARAGHSVGGQGAVRIQSSDQPTAITENVEAKARLATTSRSLQPATHRKPHTAQRSKADPEPKPSTHPGPNR